MILKQTERTAFDYTMLSTYQRCPRRYFIAFELNRVPIINQAALGFGAAIHEALAVYHTIGDIEEAKKVFLETWQNPSGDELRTEEQGLFMLDAYAYHYPFTQAIRVEERFAIEFDSFIYKGIIDMVYRSDRYVIMEHKTGRYLPKRDEYTINPQIIGYCVGAESQIKQDISVACVNFIQVAKTKKAPDIFSRVLVHVSEYKKKEWRSITEAVAMQLMKDELWLPNWNSCNIYGQCCYKEICSSPAHVRLELLENNYQEYRWNAGKDEKEG